MFSRPIERTKFSDIEAFVAEKNPENIILDYKQDWPNDLAKVIAAMANTQGGAILVGVAEEDKTGVPKDIPGVDLGAGADQLRQKVASIAYRNIYPPVMPEVAVLSLDSDTSRAVVLIRVTQSNQTPHAVDNRRRVYVRVDSITEPHSLATLHELEWLWDRRRKAIDARNVLIEETTKRSAWILENSPQNTGSHPQSSRQASADVPVLRAWAVPYFCSNEYALARQRVKALSIERGFQSKILQGYVRYPSPPNHFRSVPLGYCVYDIERHRRQYCEIGTTGLVFAEFSEMLEYRGAHPKEINYLAMIAMIDALIGFSHIAYGKSDFKGLVYLHASLHHARGAFLKIRWQNPIFEDEIENHLCPDLSVALMDANIGCQDIEAMRAQLVMDTTQRLTWAFGYDWGEDAFQNWYHKEVWQD